MKGIVDRIEDGKMAVVEVEGCGQLIISVDRLNFKVYEGAHLNIDFSLDPESESLMREEIQEMQKELLEKNKQEDE